MPSASVFYNAYELLENGLSSRTKERTLMRRKRWLDGLVSPFAKKNTEAALARVKREMPDPHSGTTQSAAR
jgi:hypothetical protein